MVVLVQKIDHYQAEPDKNLATDPDSHEYRLIVQANNLSVEIDNEMLIVHKVHHPGSGFYLGSTS